MTLVTIICIGFIGMGNTGCEENAPNSDTIQRNQQERITREATAQTGMPAIHNFWERKLLKEIYELRDQEGFTTYTYIVAENTGKLIYLGESVGYGIPAATQYTCPMRPATYAEIGKHGQGACGYALPQADPNGLFSPANAEGTWVMMLNPETHKAIPVYIEPRVIVSPFKFAQ